MNIGHDSSMTGSQDYDRLRFMVKAAFSSYTSRTDTFNLFVLVKECWKRRFASLKCISSLCQSRCISVTRQSQMTFYHTIYRSRSLPRKMMDEITHCEVATMLKS